MTPPSTAARLARQAARLNAAMTTAITRLATAVSSLNPDDAQAVLEAAVPIPVRGAAKFLEEFAAHVAAHPDALTSGESLCPPVLLRVTHVLHDAGHHVIRPGCASCGSVKTVLRRLTPQGRICGTCDARSRLATCARCGRTETRIAARRAEGGICHPCCRTDPQVVEECSECGRLRSPAVRLPDGGSLCRGCWKRPAHECVSCGQTKPAALIDDGAFCYLCYNKFRRARRTCGRCGKPRVIARNAAGDQPDLCNSCYRGPETTCSICSRIRPCKGVTRDKPICEACYRRPPHTCCRCGKQRGITAHWPMGPICDPCYNAVLRSPTECNHCRTSQPLIARDEDGAGICGPCAGFDADYRCHNCGRTGNPYGHGGCAHCVLADRVRNLLAGPDGGVSPQLQRLANALTQVETPFKQIQWIKDSSNAQLLAQIASQAQPISHDLLDKFPPSRNLHYVRQMMTQTGVLPERHEDLERLPSWLDHHLLGKPAKHANLIRPFLHWFLLRRARSRAAVRRFPASVGRDLRRRILIALELLTWLDEQELAPSALQQDDLDRWLDENGTQRRNLVRYFLKWTTERGLTRKLTIPSSPHQEPAELLDDEERWPLLQRCLTDETLPIDVRAAGALTLLFGLSTERVRHLTADQLTHNDQHAYLTAGRRPILLPPRLANLLQRLATQPQPRLTVSHEQRGPRRLFPGRVPGQPIANHALTTRLARHGIKVRAARNGALAALAADLPAAILADVLGMHINTAVRWVVYARRDWAEYLAARAAEQNNARRKEGKGGE
jgi:hypothetical protein